MSSFVIIGMGFIFDRHVQAIKQNMGDIVGVCDIDPEKKYKYTDAPFYTDWKEMLNKVKSDYVVICTPNNLHAEMALKAIKDYNRKVICEKPPVINESQYKSLELLDRLNIVLQCRYSLVLQHLRERQLFANKKRVKMNIEVHRDSWYMESWKGDPAQSGGLLYNIGCHYFDLLCWFFGKAENGEITSLTSKRIEGWIVFNKAIVEFVVSINADIDKQKRIIEIGAEKMNLTQLGFESLHSEVYRAILSDKGYKLKMLWI